MMVMMVMNITGAPVKGSYDDKLKWPVNGRAHFTIFNQERNSNHYTKTFDFSIRRDGEDFIDNIPEYCRIPLMMSSSTYSTDDTIYVKVKVVMEDHKSWLHMHQ